ncbi:ABC transporter permease [Nocardioides sp. LHG3406-4]|uniref:ABC transporter permease n=1 Tax=Nocardioides sp. LHG3406-4 TaxID=2804575 RepID=UPI003CF9BF31
MTSNSVAHPVRPGGAPSAGAGPGPSLPRRLATALLERYALLLALVVLVACFSVMRPDSFFTVANLTSMLGIQAAIGVLAIGVTVVLLVGEFDLSAAAVMGTSASLMAHLTSVQGHSVAFAVVVVLAGAVLTGAVVAFFVTVVGIHSFIVTLGMGTLVTGVGLGTAGSTTIGGVPDSLTDTFRAHVLGIEVAFFYMLALAVVGWVVLQKTPIGRSIFFTGEAPAAARLAGIRVQALRAASLIASSVIAALAGIMLIGQIGAASPTISSPYLLPAYAAAFLGATAFTPGRFNVTGTVVAIYLLAVSTVGFQLLGLSSWITDVFNGAVLVLAVAFSRLVGRGS